METKLRIVAIDPFEKHDIRVKLNLGHTYAHALESTSSFKVKHGLGVINGILFELFLSEFEYQDFLDYIIGLGYPFFDFDPKKMVDSMINDKKNKSVGKIVFLVFDDNFNLVPREFDSKLILNKLTEFKVLINELIKP